MPPRSFSALKAFCSHPETFERRPKKSRDEAAERGTEFHKYIEEWVKATRDGRVFHCDGAAEPIRTWIRKMRENWTPPPGLETELAVGLEMLPYPRYVDVVEPKPHEYEPADGQTPLLTAGRADLVWLEDGLVKVADIKSGQFYLGDPSRLRQLLGQGFACLTRAKQQGHDVTGFVAGVYYARTGLFDWGQPIAEGTTAWAEAWRLVVEAAKRDRDPHPGPWCLGCWDRKDCAKNPEAA